MFVLKDFPKIYDTTNSCPPSSLPNAGGVSECFLGRGTLGWVIAFMPGLSVKLDNKQGLKFFVSLELHELKRISMENFIS